MEQAGDLGQVTKAGQELVSTIRNLALANDVDRLQESSDRFHEYIEHILEVRDNEWFSFSDFVKENYQHLFNSFSFFQGMQTTETRRSVRVTSSIS